MVIHDRLGALVLQGADVTAITRMMADLVGRRVLLLDALLQVVAMALPSASAVSDDWMASAGRRARATCARVLATLARERRPLRVPPMADFGVDASCVLAPVAVGDVDFRLSGHPGRRRGRRRPGDDLDLQIVQHAATCTRCR